MLTTVIIIIIINFRVIKSRRITWTGACSTYGKSRCLYRVMVAELEGKGHLGRPMRRWEDNIKMGIQEVGFELWTGSIWLKMRKVLNLLLLRGVEPRLLVF
jgi:hypothetical protein